jgi:hypothetical protein
VTASAYDSDETMFHGFTITEDLIDSVMVEGTNTLAVEVHQASPTSSDQGMDLTLTGSVVVAADPVAPGDEPYELLIEEVPGLEDPSSFLFTRDIIHEIDLTIPAESWAALEAYPYDYQPASITLDGHEVASVGVRLRGKYGSFTEITEKPKLKIDFNRFVDGQRFFGLESLSLNNSIVDCSYLKEVVSYRVFKDAGLPTPRIAFTHITVNGSDYGLYQIVDSEDDIWLKRHWEDASGNLYDGKYVMEWPWIWIGFVDFYPGFDHLFELEEGVDVGLEDIYNITSVNTSVDYTDWGAVEDSYYSDMGAYLDWEQWHRHIAAEHWTGHLDGYWGNTNNYRVYFDPEDGLAEFVTWDLDYSLIPEEDWGMNWNWPASYISDFCKNNEECYANQAAAEAWLISELDLDSIEAEFDEALALIDGHAHDDPRDYCSSWDVTNWQSDVRSWILNRNDEISSYWGL